MNLYNKLSPCQKEVLRLKALGLSQKEIAKYMNIAISTVKTHLVNAYEKLGLKVEHSSPNCSHKYLLAKQYK